MHELKFKVGDKVRVIADEFADSCSHELEIGSEYLVEYTQKESREGEFAQSYREYLLVDPNDIDRGAWVTETEIEPVE